MKDKIEKIQAEIEAYRAEQPEQAEAFRLKYLTKKGVIPSLFGEFKNIPPEQKKEFGKILNGLKQKAEQKYRELKEAVDRKSDQLTDDIDLTLPADFMPTGSRHPISIVRNQMIDIFKRIGFTVYTGPEIEDDWHNFSALNFVEDHPARDMQDTFFIEKDPDILLRTHTSSAQIRAMQQTQPPIRQIYPGRVFRNEAISARSHCIFHQIEGLYVDENVSFVDLKQTLYYFAKEFYGQDVQVRFRPSYFPFTEPSAEMDVSCFLCGGKGCKICKHTGWVEILGCGMVDPNVLSNCNINPEKYTGFAFGIGIERTTMVKYQIEDIRLFFENDVRFLEQFRSVV
ncbi:MAG: phenylalanine--tRNA ligase subunit alpha [Bacteroidales bacterium]|nr:phenylalanine--tRNA ligase subunit alpha [Bacteroidales bacterium]MCF8387732.1 phenylalanine--tRNA ligase subunit alpha [Bacteroidales bacterium]MCF8397548.1 phenylalanine--tRNA ligase subunit alpha [Bacteroidales bacterium]